MGLLALTCTRHVVTHQFHHQITWIGPSMRKQSVVGACKVWTKVPQNTQTEPGAHSLQLIAKQVSGIRHNDETRGSNSPRESSFFFSCWRSSYLQDKSPTQKNLERFMKIIPLIGTFHQQMSSIYALHKRFKCSGLDDILVTAGIVIQGSVDQALRDRHYSRGVCCILLWREILIKKCLSQILQYEVLPEAVQHSLDIVHDALTATQATLPEANSCLDMMFSWGISSQRSMRNIIQTWGISGSRSRKCLTI